MSTITLDPAFLGAETALRRQRLIADWGRSLWFAGHRTTAPASSRGNRARSLPAGAGRAVAAAR
ncbi:hypothetical protein [Ornithinimicrobium cerasi]|uniref:Uncharacterized protein n=1 Tax=Ornithinimicrobium cerasi TaxID=2248773 RepID=A0A285VTV4_9MICO|nr:hypothetical protein [Ornithinimicrobium cerasi]SOC57489.1 hypothetical protein SAMN05421879_11320 [Ornithinimicrobium cerasi]